MEGVKRKMPNELISIIVPVYNVQSYIKKSVNSILKQSYRNLEIILVDDGSTDESGKICDFLKKMDPRVKVIHRINGGLSAARNSGIDVSTGSYIVFIDSDDYIEKKFVEKLYQSMKKNKADIAVCGYKRISENGTILFENKPVEELNLSIRKAIQYILQDKEIKNYAWNKMYKKELFLDIRYPVGENYEDVATTYKVFLKAQSVSIVNDCLYYYRIREGSIVSDEKDYYGNLQLFRNKRQQIEELSNIYEDALDYGYSNLIMCYINAFSAGAKCFGIKRLEEMKECEEYLRLVSNPQRRKKLSNLQRIKLYMTEHFPKVLQCIYWILQITRERKVK